MVIIDYYEEESASNEDDAVNCPQSKTCFLCSELLNVNV